MIYQKKGKANRRLSDKGLSPYQGKSVSFVIQLSNVF